MQALLSPSYSEADLLHCLENSATVLDSISSVTSEPGDFDQLTGEAQREIIDNLGIVSNILQFLGERIGGKVFALPVSGHSFQIQLARNTRAALFWAALSL